MGKDECSYVDCQVAIQQNSVKVNRNEEDIKQMMEVVGSFVESMTEIKVSQGELGQTLDNLKEQIVILTKETRQTNKIKERLAVAESEINTVKKGIANRREYTQHSENLDVKRGELKVKWWHVGILILCTLISSAITIFGILHKG